ncbi:MAG: 2-amino-4-hydroxy-6-hydroxymethyldihydropteridine diphosphokinase [Gammaproteobacteria bacterium]
MAHAWVSIGTNIERRKNITLALRLLEARYGALERSSVYESDAVGFDSAPFYNLVVGFHCEESPLALQAQLHAIETESGRARTSALAARTLDLDLLLYDDQVIDEEGLVLPREDITRYAFVLCPLAEIAPNERHPVSGRRYADHWADFDADAQPPLRRVDWPPVRVI